MNHGAIAQQAFSEGLRYEAAACELLRREEVLGSSVFGAPAAILHAFAAELYLKSLLIRVGNLKAAKGHDLLKLFDRLSQCSRDAIGRCYTPATDENFQNFRDLLKVEVPPFAAFRYRYEVDGRNSFYSSTVGETLRKAILKLEPEWQKEKIGAMALIGRPTWSWLDPATATVVTEAK